MAQLSGQLIEKDQMIYKLSFDLQKAYDNASKSKSLEVEGKLTHWFEGWGIRTPLYNHKSWYAKIRKEVG